MDPTLFNVPIGREARSFEQQALDSFRLLEKLLQIRRFNYDDFWYDDMLSLMNRRRGSWDDEMRRARDEFFLLFPHDGADNVHICSPFLLPSKLDSNFTIMPSLKSPLVVTNDSSATSTSENGPVKSLYDRGADGLVHFKLHFNMQDFKPEDIKVTVKGNKLELSASSEQKTENSSSYLNFSRTVEVPDNIDLNQLKCTLTSDKVLMLDAPVKAPDYQNAIISENKQVVLPLTQVRPPSPMEPERQLVTGKNGLSLIDVGGTKKLHLELPVDEEFSPDLIKIELKNRSILVHARCEEQSETGMAYREFRKEYGIPEYVDPNSLRATVSGKVITIEANLLC